MTKNEITGDKLISKKNSDAYRDNYDAVFRRGQVHKDRNFDDDGYDQHEKIANYTLIALIMLCVGSIGYDLNATEIVHKFGNPSFSGINQSAHYLTIDEQERTRKDTLAQKAQDALEDAQREADNTTLAKFLRNLESRIYSTLAKDISESLFDYNNPGTLEDPVTGEIWLEGNRIIWTNNGVSITLVVEEWLDGVLISTTTIEIPVGSFGGCFSDCATG
jgi:flavodoxin